MIIRFSQRKEDHGRHERNNSITPCIVAALLMLMERKFGNRLTETDRQIVESADTETLLKWLEKILSANSIEEIFH